MAARVRSLAAALGNDGLSANAQAKLAQAASGLASSKAAINGMKQQPAATRLEHVNALMNAIEKASPSFFTQFGNALKSGNHVAIDKALRDGIKQLLEQAAVGPTWNTLVSDGWLAFDNDVAVWSEVAIVIGAVVAVIAVVAADVGPDGNVLATQQLVDTLSTRFGAPASIGGVKYNNPGVGGIIGQPVNGGVIGGIGDIAH
jgi:SdpC family antimicrobial peptide